MRKRRLILTSILVFVLLAGTVALAASQYAIDRSAVTAGGGTRSSDNYTMNDAVGEAAGGISQGDSHILRSGFSWAAPAAPALGYRDIPLGTGWNLTGLPLVPGNPAIDALLGPIAGNVDIVWGYDNSNPGSPWTSWSPLWGGDLTQMVDCMGYWIKMSSADILRVYGYPGVPPAGPRSIPLNQDWNLSSLPFVPDNPAIDVLLGPISGDVDIVWGYDEGNQGSPWTSWSPLWGGDLTQMVDCMGYWIRTDAACDLPADGSPGLEYDNGEQDLPDLVVTSLTIDPNPAAPDESITISRTFQNQGDAASPACQHLWTIEGFPGQSLGGTVPSLQPEEFHTAQTTIENSFCDQGGTLTTVMTVDSGGVVEESNEDNNTRTESLICGGGGGSGVSDIVGRVAPVDVYAIEGATVRISGDGIDQTDACDGDGVYEFHDIPAGYYELSASPAGYQPFSKTLWVPGDMPVPVYRPYTTLTLAPEGHVMSSASGRVIDGTGAPVPNATVATLPNHYIAFTDELGEYSFDEIYSVCEQGEWCEPYKFIATAQGYAGSHQQVEVLPGGSAAVPDIVLGPPYPGSHVFFEEEFDTDLSNWMDIEQPDRMYITDTVARTGSGSLEMELRRPDEEPAGWMHHWVDTERVEYPGIPHWETAEPLAFEGSETIYIRWYQRFDSDYLFGGHIVYGLSGSLGPVATDHALYFEVASPDPDQPAATGHPLVMVRSTTEIGHLCGEPPSEIYCPYHAGDTTILVNPDHWYCFEVMATMNDPYDPATEQPCRTNGTITIWVDNVEVLTVDNVFMRPALLTMNDSVLNSYSRVVISPEYKPEHWTNIPPEIDSMHSWIDDMVVANYRVGP